MIIYLFLSPDEIGYWHKIAPGDGGFFMKQVRDYGIKAMGYGLG
jgi:hypothetical protein